MKINLWLIILLGIIIIFLSGCYEEHSQTYWDDKQANLESCYDEVNNYVKLNHLNCSTVISTSDPFSENIPICCRQCYKYSETGSDVVYDVCKLDQR